ATDETDEYVATERFKFDEANTASIQKSYEQLETQAVARLDSESISDDRRKIEWLADARSEGQRHEVRLSVPKGKMDDKWLTQVEQAFHAAHLEGFGHKFENGTVEVINIRVDASAVMDELPTPLPNTTGGLEAALVETRPVTFD